MHHSHKIIESINENYKTLLVDKIILDVSAFCLQWGERFPLYPNKGFLFVGKAVDGWLSSKTDIEFLLNTQQRNGFKDLRNQLNSGYSMWGSVDFGNKRKEGFWKITEQIAKEFHTKEWFCNIAWTNLYKIAPFDGGDPCLGLIGEQQKSCLEIFQKEVELLSPEYVFMLTSGWEKEFLKYLNDNKTPKAEKTVKWGQYSSKLLLINGVKFIASPFPHAKPETSHKEAILELMKG